MNKTTTTLIAALSGAIGFSAGSATQKPSASAAPIIKLVNTKLVRVEERLPDGGTGLSWAARSCGYQMPADGGTQHVAEPCWETRVSGAVFGPVEDALMGGD